MQQNGEVWSVVIPLLYSVVDTSSSLSLLAQAGKVRDSFVLSRTAFETIVNVCFILAKGDFAAKRAKQHAIQKSYRDLDRRLDINGQTLHLKWEGKPNLERDSELQSALAEFTNKKEREITSWTPETVQEQISAIDIRYGKNISANLQFALMSIYRHASEIAHGTFFGALFSLGLTSPSGPPKSQVELENHQRQNLSMLLMMLGLSISALIMALAEEIQSLNSQAAESKSTVKELQNVSWLK